MSTTPELSYAQIKLIARRLLKIPAEVPFHIADKDQTYALLRQEGRYGTAHNYLRGTIINYVTETVVCGHSYNIIECIQPVLSSSNGDDIVVFTDNRQQVRLPLVDVELCYGIEGTNIIVWMDDDMKIRVSNHRKLNSDDAQSSYASSPPYIEYFNINGVDLTKFYRPGAHSRVVHRLILQYADLAPCCKRNSEGNICYDGYFVEIRRRFSEGTVIDDCPVEPSDIFPRTTRNLADVVGSSSPIVFITDTDIPLDEANDFLANGYYSPPTVTGDLRLLTGEFVYVFHLTSSNIYRVKSLAWQWRFDNNHFPNVLQNAYELYSYANQISLYNRMRFPTLHYQDDALLYKKIDNGIPITTLDDTSTNVLVDVTTYKGRLYNIMLCLLLVTRISKQKDIIVTLSHYLMSCRTIAQEVLILSTEDINNSINHPKRKLREILKTRSHTLMKESLESRLSSTRHTNDKTLKSTVDDIERHLQSLDGVDVYGLSRDFTKLHTPIIRKTDTNIFTSENK